MATQVELPISHDLSRMFEPRDDVNIYAIEIRGCISELEKAASVGLSKHSPCNGWSQWKGRRLPE